MWSMHSGSNSPEDQAKLRRWRRRSSVPPNEVGAPVPWEPFVTRSEGAAIVLESATVFSTGVVLGLRRVLRRPPDPGLERRPSFPGGDVLLGVTLDDGRSTSNVQTFPLGAPNLEAAPDDLALSMLNGSSSGTESTHRYLLSPLPTGGPVTVVLASPDVGIAESTVVLDGDALQDARRRIQVLWERTEDDDIVRGPSPRRPDLPPGGWFERHAGPTT